MSLVEVTLVTQSLVTSPSGGHTCHSVPQLLSHTGQSVPEYIQTLPPWGTLAHTIESTTFPGTTQEILLPELESGSGLKANKDFYIAYSPEREDPNNKEYSIATTPKVIGADDPKSLELANAITLEIP